MFHWILIAWIILGIIAIFLLAYDAFSQTFDFGLVDGWELWWWQRYLLWIGVIIFAPYSFYIGLKTQIKDRPYVKEWRDKGSFIRKL
jgi:hypothetical protein